MLPCNPMIQPETFTLRVRSQPIGVAHGVENAYRAVEFVCDRGGRVETTPEWAIDATLEAPRVERFRTWTEREPSLGELCRGTTHPDDAED